MTSVRVRLPANTTNPSRRRAAITTSLAAFLLSAGWLYQRKGQRRDALSFQAPGVLVDIGGRRLHVIRSGRGTPGRAVVILPALGATALEWHRVTAAMPEDITVYVVDRGGLGWSDPVAPGPRSPRTLATEATALLDALGLTSVVLVGHSYGGLVARVVAAAHPERITGLVLVDSSHEHQMRPLAAASSHLRSTELWRTAIRAQARPLGWYRAWHDLTGRRRLIRDAGREVGEQQAPAAVARALTSAHRRAVVGELLGMALAPRTVPEWTRRLGDLRMTVLTVGDGHGWGPAYPAWLDMQRLLVSMSSRSRHLVLSGTGHHMNHDVPDAVAHAIVELLPDRPSR